VCGRTLRRNGTFGAPTDGGAVVRATKEFIMGTWGDARDDGSAQDDGGEFKFAVIEGARCVRCAYQLLLDVGGKGISEK
jgi:hypothetical protein